MKDTTRQILTPLLQSDETILPEYIERAVQILSGEEAEPESLSQQEKPEPYMTLRAVAKALNISACSLWRWRVPKHAFGGRPKYRLSEVEAYLRSEQMKKRAAELKKQRRLQAQ